MRRRLLLAVAARREQRDRFVPELAERLDQRSAIGRIEQIMTTRQLSAIGIDLLTPSRIDSAPSVHPRECPPVGA